MTNQATPIHRSTDIIKRVLSSKGYTFKTLSLGMQERRFVQICSPEGQPLLTLAEDNPLYPFATSTARGIAKNKLMAYDFARLNQVPVPQTAAVSRDDGNDAAVKLLERCKTVIVKPAQASASSGLTLDITDQAKLLRAIGEARQHSATAIVQQQFFGEEVRFTIINGEAKIALLREKPKVIGDGTATVRQLIAKENADRQSLQGMLAAYPQLDEKLVPAHILEDETVLRAGEIRELNKSTMVRGGASIYNIVDTIHPGYIKAAERAAEGLGKGFIVVDMMLANYKEPPTPDNHVLIEYNLSPALVLYYSCRDGRHALVAEDYLCPMLERAMGAVL